MPQPIPECVRNIQVPDGRRGDSDAVRTFGTSQLEAKRAHRIGRTKSGALCASGRLHNLRSKGSSSIRFPEGQSASFGSMPSVTDGGLGHLAWLVLSALRLEGFQKLSGFFFGPIPAL